MEASRQKQEAIFFGFSVILFFSFHFFSLSTESSFFFPLCVKPPPPSSWIHNHYLLLINSFCNPSLYHFLSPSTVTSIISLGFSSDHHRLPCYFWTTISNDTISASASAFHLSDSAIHGPHRSSSASLASWQPSVALTGSDSIIFSLGFLFWQPPVLPSSSFLCIIGLLISGRGIQQHHQKTFSTSSTVLCCLLEQGGRGRDRLRLLLRNTVITNSTPCFSG